MAKNATYSTLHRDLLVNVKREIKYMFITENMATDTEYTSMIHTPPYTPKCIF